ncbi:MAG TPA: bifunctional (p)ppGpp synthetase/guanosine-3',5'-bis(diphosphate) 3'-pyrophosphohydrolase [Terriglobia bacterium]|nr:bifunctional (p)ppGpp synthetase/guanosine-3',5'-bis(diphosphate) 3'-pyrophosphohydrolase [Terriglobia bacterium]
MVSFEQLAQKVHAYRPGDDLSLLHKAYDFSATEHRSQTRLNGEPFFSHPLEVANVLADLKLDVVCLAGGMLHDVVEDTPTTIERIRQEFGPDVAHIVEGVTKISRLQFNTAEEKQAENLRKMFLAMVDDVRVVLVKLADRLHNMRTLDALPLEKRQRVAQETLDIYAPIAHRLGMGKIRGELEDLAFRHLEPDAYEEVREAVESRRKVNEVFLAQVRTHVIAVMKEHDIPARVEGRIKRLYSIWLKLQRQQIPIEKVYDLLAIRIITDSVKNCYGALGVIHQTWPPIPDRIKDFIAMPRPNFYQSLHTSVIGPHGQPFELQIRTEEMHRVAEEGIAAHWKYKDGKPAQREDEQRMAWLRRLVDLQQEMRDPSDYLSTLKIDLYPQEVYTFTPKGKVVVLPREATPIDFAYSIHTEVGHHCVSAKVNGRMVPLKSKLENGDIVEITTAPGQHPSRDWLSVVKTARARNKIKHWINLAERQQAIEIGRKLVEKEARRFNVVLKEVTEADYLRVASDYGCATTEDLLAGVGYGKFGPRQVLGKLAPSLPEEPEASPSLASTVKRALGIERDLAIQVHGHNDLMVYRAKCCNPVRGEEIVGYVTRGKGIAVHSKSCHNVQNLLYDADRRIEVEWSGPKYTLYTVKLALTTEDRRGLLAEVTSVISDVHSNIQNIQAHTGEERATIDVTLDTVDIQHLRRIVSSLRKIDGVYEVKRITN